MRCGNARLCSRRPSSTAQAGYLGNQRFDPKDTQGRRALEI